MSDEVKPEVKQEQEQPKVEQTTEVKEQNGTDSKPEVETKPDVETKAAADLPAEEAEALGAKVAKQSRSPCSTRGQASRTRLADDLT